MVATQSIYKIPFWPWKISQVVSIPHCLGSFTSFGHAQQNSAAAAEWRFYTLQSSLTMHSWL